jgi:hypothetical protein
MDISPVARNFNANDVFSSWDSALAQSFSPRHTHGAANNCSSSVESQSGTCPTSEAIEQEIMLPTLRGKLPVSLHAFPLQSFYTEF